MESRPASPFLNLPQELRDLIFEFAVTEGPCHGIEDRTVSDARIKRQTTGNERWGWSIHYAPESPQATYLNLLVCNKQLKAEIEDFISRPRTRESTTGKLLLVMQYPNLWPQWHHIPGPPEKTRYLDILIKVDHMYHPAFMSNGPHNAILTTVFEVVKRYIHRGPHLARSYPLDQPLELHTVRVTLAPPVPFEDMTFVYGFPAQQLEILFNEFRGLMRRLCRSGLMFPSVEIVEVRIVGQEFERFYVTSNIWDEQDYTFFQNGGYCWEAGECLT